MNGVRSRVLILSQAGEHHIPGVTLDQGRERRAAAAPISRSPSLP